MGKPKVFISVGSHRTQVQQDAINAIFSVIDASGLAPRELGKNEWSSEQPLRAIRRTIDECHGAVIIAFTRYEFQDGVERTENQSNLALRNVRLPTVWNQIEAALAYGKGQPLLVICEHGLREDGLLEDKHDWQVFRTDFQATDFLSERFSGYVRSWKNLVDQHVADTSTGKKAPDDDLSKMTISKLLGLLTAPQLWAILGSIGSLLVGTAILGFKLGGGKLSW